MNVLLYPSPASTILAILGPELPPHLMYQQLLLTHAVASCVNLRAATTTSPCLAPSIQRSAPGLSAPAAALPWPAAVTEKRLTLAAAVRAHPHCCCCCCLMPGKRHQHQVLLQVLLLGQSMMQVPLPAASLLLAATMHAGPRLSCMRQLPALLLLLLLSPPLQGLPVVLQNR